MSYMTNKKRARGAKIDTSDIREILLKIAKENQSKDKKLVKNSEVQSMLKIHKNIDVSSQTIRDKGFRHRGYFEKLYPESCSYNYKGDTNYRGLVIQPEKFIEEVEQ